MRTLISGYDEAIGLLNGDTGGQNTIALASLRAAADQLRYHDADTALHVVLAAMASAMGRWD